MTVRVLVVDDQPQLRTLVRRFFSISDHALEIVAEAATATEALALAAGAAAPVATVPGSSSSPSCAPPTRRCA